LNIRTALLPVNSWHRVPRCQIRCSKGLTAECIEMAARYQQLTTTGRS